MIEAWFSPEFAQSLKWLSLLSFLSLLSMPAARGLYRRAIMSIWYAAIALGVLCLGAVAAGRALGQPDHVVLPLLVIRRRYDGRIWRHAKECAGRLSRSRDSQDRGAGSVARASLPIRSPILAALSDGS